MAEAARQAGDFETFHDLAWAAYREGKRNDTELMLLVARAQSLSGRPGDALVMLERIAALGGATDATTSEDFARVRALPRWTEVAERLSVALPVTEPASASAKASTSAKATVDKPVDKPSAPAPPAKAPAPSAPAPAPSTKAPAPSASAPALSPKEPLSFTTVLTPGALAYDAVSRRFIIADGRARRVAVVDEHTGQVATLVGEQGALGEIRGITIDPRRGDLWVATLGDEGASLHRMQLISGRMLQTVSLSIEDPVVAMAHVRAAGLIVADAKGIVWRVRENGKAEKLANLEYVPLGFAADARGRLYVAGGASRIARFSISNTLRRIDTVEVAGDVPPNAPFAVSGDRIHFVVPEGGSFTIRSFPVR